MCNDVYLIMLITGIVLSIITTIITRNHYVKIIKRLESKFIKDEDLPIITEDNKKKYNMFVVSESFTGKVISEDFTTHIDNYIYLGVDGVEKLWKSYVLNKNMKFIKLILEEK